jgi:hypothetical protein
MACGLAANGLAVASVIWWPDWPSRAYLRMRSDACGKIFALSSSTCSIKELAAALLANRPAQ